MTTAITLHELSTSAEDRRRLITFYSGAYEREFPDSDERESLQNIERYLELKASGWYGRNNYHVVVAYRGESPVGGCILDYLDEPNVGVIEFVFASASVRGQGVGRRLAARAQRLAKHDAWRNGRTLQWLAAEMNDPFIAPSVPDNMDPFLRARIWGGWGFGVLDCPYVQPALSANQQPAEGLVLIAKCLDPAWGFEVPAKQVASLVAAYMRWAMRIEAPADNPQYRALGAWLQGRTTVRRLSLRRYIGEFEDRSAEAAAFDVAQVEKAGQPEFGAAVAVYRRAFGSGATAVEPTVFASGLARYDDRSYRYHFWALRSRRHDSISGMASFFGFTGMGFGGYVVLEGPLQGVGALRPLLARIEQQLIADALGISGWLIECASDHTVQVFGRQGFRPLAVPYRQPALPGSVRAESAALTLMYKPLGRVYGAPSLSSERLVLGLHEVLRWVYGIERPEVHPTMQTLVSALRGSDSVPLA